MSIIKSSYKISILTILSFGLLFTSCETTELDLANNPNELTPDQSSPDLFLNSIQVDFGRFVEQMGAIGSQVTRIDYMNGRNYQQVYSPSSFDDEWGGAFQAPNGDEFNGILADIRALAPIAERDDLFTHLGISQVIESYTIVTLVDFFGDIPYTEALQGRENLNPSLDDGATIYEAALNLLDLAIANFDKSPSSEPATDLYYGGKKKNWIKAANTLKMKIYLQRRLVE